MSEGDAEEQLGLRHRFHEWCRRTERQKKADREADRARVDALYAAHLKAIRELEREYWERWGA